MAAITSFPEHIASAAAKFRLRTQINLTELAFALSGFGRKQAKKKIQASKACMSWRMEALRCIPTDFRRPRAT